MKKKSIIEMYKGMSFSDASLKIKSKYPQADTDLMEKNSLKVELEQLMAYQEKKKLVQQMEETVKQFKMGGKLQYKWGTEPEGLFGDPNKQTFSTLADQPPVGIQDALSYQGQINNYNPGQISWANTWADTPRPQDNIQPLAPREIPPMGFNGPPKPFTGQVGGLSSGIGIVDPYQVNVDTSKVSTSPNDTVGTRDGKGNAYTPALIGQGISTAINAGLLLGGYDKVAPVENPYESQIMSNMASRGIDTTQQRNQILSAYGAAKGNLGNVRSANVRNALDANLMNVTQDNLAESKLQEQQINQGYKADYANVLNNLGQQKASARTYAEQLNTDSKSNWQSGVSELGKHLADMGLSQTTLKLNNTQQTAIANIMSQKYPDFMIGEAALKSYLNGTYTNEEFVKLKEAAAKNPELQSILDFATFQKQQKENIK